MNLKFVQSFESNIRFYNELKSFAFAAFKKGQVEKTLKYIYYAASYAWLVHIGIWFDNDLENLLVKIGKYCNSKKSSIIKSNNIERKKNKIAYIASILRDIGGHNILLKHWTSILKERYNQQELYITKIDKKPLNYPFLKKALEENKVSIYELPEKSNFLIKIFKLIDIIEKNNPETLIIFAHPNDVTIIPAIIALSKKPFIIFFNHADHVFWLGKKISDCIIEQRIEGAKFSKKFRKVMVPQYIVPLTTEIQPKKISKKKFGIPEHATLSISVGGIMKIENPSGFSYYETIESILKNFPDHYHMFVTDYPPKTIPKELEKTPKDVKKRFIINGPFANLEPIYGVADLLIDTFPIGGGMVIVDAMACGLPVVTYQNKAFSIVSDGGGKTPIDYPYLTTSYKKFIDNISQLIENPQLRKKAGEQLFNYYQQNLSPKAIGKLLYNIIEGENTKKLIFQDKDFYEAEFKYDKELGQKTFLIEKKNFLILDLKHFGFSFKQRLKIFRDALSNREFKSIKEIFIFGVITVFRRLISVLSNILISQKKLQTDNY